ncbi:MAG: formylglycine-generating enzyme family protein [Proteobacteria bacterium]|nr:formylglycine-generating enzyme family protein [Pseudomonadota bacterium]
MIKRFCLSLLIIFFCVNNLFAQKYSVIILDINAPEELNLDKLKLTYSIREDITNNEYFAVLNRNTSNNMLKMSGNGNGLFYVKKNRDKMDYLSDVLLLNNVDFAISTDIEKKNGKYLLTILLQNYEGPLLYFSEEVSSDEKEIESKITKIIKKINETLNLNENLNENPYEFEEMVYIPAGKAIIGSFNGETDEAPQREVYVSGFYIDKYEVTNAQYKRFVDATGRKPPENVVNPEYTIWKNGSYPEELAYHPVVNVTWYDARDYCNWVGKRLPTAIEWEKAARGPYGNIYPWGNEYFDGYANLYMKGVSYEKRQTVPVGTFTKSKSFYGIFDMAGNAWEWTDSSSSKDIAKNGNKKIVKGGGWGFNGNKYTARSSYNLYFTPDYTSNCLGFRCAK